MKFLGQHIYDLISRFRNDVFLEDVGSGTIASGGNLGLDSNNKIVKANVPTTHDAVTLAGSLDYITLSGQEITRNAINLTTDVSGILPVEMGGTGATSLTDNAVLLGNGASAIEASSHLSYTSPSGNLDYLKIGDSSTTGAGIITDNAAGLSLQVEANTGTDAAGSDMTFIAGTSTGNATGGSFVFRSSASVGSSGTSVNVPSEIAVLSQSGHLQIDGGITTGSTSFVSSSGVVQVATQGTIDHDSLANFVAAEHYRWDTDISGTATIHTNNITDLHGAGIDGSANQLLTDDGDGTVTSETDLTFSSGALAMQSSSLQIFTLKRTSTGSDNDTVGVIRFTGNDDADNSLRYAAISAKIIDASDGAEEGQLNLAVASHDGEEVTGLSLTSGDAEDEIDVTIGNGTTSVTTIAGTLTMGSTATLDNSGNLLNNAATATALATSRNLQVDLTSTSAQGFTGAANATSIGVNGTLPVANGGTGLTSISTLLNSNVPHYDYLHINCQMTATSTNQYMGYGGHYNFNIGATAYSDGGSANNKNTTKWSHYQAISAATIHTVYYNFTTTGGSGNDFVFELWEIVPGSGSSNNTTNLLKQYSISGNSSNDFILTATDTTGYSLAAGAGLLPVIRKVSSAWSGNIFGEITIKFQY